jgi:hypothetical protein
LWLSSAEELIFGASGISVDSWVKIEAAEMEEDHGFQPGLVPEAASRFPQRFCAGS